MGNIVFAMNKVDKGLEPLYDSKNEFQGYGYLSHTDQVFYVCDKDGFEDYEIDINQIERILNMSDVDMPSSYYRCR